MNMDSRNLPHKYMDSCIYQKQKKKQTDSCKLWVSTVAKRWMLRHRVGDLVLCYCFTIVDQYSPSQHYFSRLMVIGRTAGVGFNFG